MPLFESAAAPPRPMLSSSVRPLFPVADEDVVVAGEDAGRHEVGRVRVERDEAPVRRHRSDEAAEAAAVLLGAPGRDADPLGRAGGAVADEYVRHPVGVAPDEVGGIGREEHVAPPAEIAETKLPWNPPSACAPLGRDAYARCVSPAQAGAAARVSRRARSPDPGSACAVAFPALVPRPGPLRPAQR